MIKDIDKKLEIILTGTDPRSKKGGIAFAMPGYILALKKADLNFKFFPTYSPDTVFTKYFLFLASLPGIMKEIRRIRREKKICFVYSHAGAGLSIFREGVLLLASKLTGAQTILQVHSSSTLKYFASPFKKRCFQLMLGGADNIFVLTPWWKRVYIKNSIKKPIYVISNSLPADWEKRASDKKTVQSHCSKINILVMSRLVEGKGVELIIESMLFLPDKYHLSIAGDGPLMSSLKNRAASLKLDNRVNFFGWVYGKAKQKALDEAHIFCHLTSLDAMPMNILEAMANGLPVVALKWGPIPDIVSNESTGLLVEVTEPKKIAESIMKLDDPVIRGKMGLEAQNRVLKYFTADKIGRFLSSNLEQMANYEN